MKKHPLEIAKEALKTPILISLFDYTGTWSKPYRIAGWRVLQIDLKFGFDILTWDYKSIPKELVRGILAAPPCTDFTVSGAQYWKQKDANGTTEKSLALVWRVLKIVNYFEPDFWALENPVGRLPKLIPIGKPWYWNPCDFGDPWTKKTGLWGNFRRPEKNPVDPIRWTKQGSYTQILGSKSERTKELRSVTPEGFANAFFKANH